MAEIPVKKRSSNWWVWLIALLVLAAVIWFLWEAFADRERTAATPAATEPTATTAVPPPVPGTGEVPATAAPGTATGEPGAATGQPGAATGQPGAATGETGAAAGEPITDTGAYAATGDKLSLVGRRADLTEARVTRVVGPKTFAVMSGSEEMYVMVGDELDMAVGTQGQIDEGSVLHVEGSFRRLQSEEISDLSNNRFRDLTEQEREFLRDRQVYLEATDISKLS